MKQSIEELKEKYPHVSKSNPDLFADYLHHYMIMAQVSDKLEVPLEELMCFFYKGKVKQDLMEREEIKFNVRESNNLMRKV